MLTTEQIFNELKSKFEMQTGRQPSGVILGLLATLSNSNKDFYTFLRYVEKNAFLETADKEHLFLHTGELLPYKLPTKATLRAIFIFDRDHRVAIYPGTEFKDSDNNIYILNHPLRRERLSVILNIIKDENNKVYVNNINYKFDSGNSIPIPRIPNLVSMDYFNLDDFTEGSLTIEYKDVTISGVIQERMYLNYEDPSQFLKEDGSLKTQYLEILPDFAYGYLESKEAKKISKELKQDDLLEFSNLEFSTIKNISVESFENGTDEEPLEDYRERVRNFLKPKSYFSEDQIKNILLEKIPELRMLSLKRLLPTENSPAELGFFVLDINNDFSEVLKEKVLSILNVLKPIGINENIYVCEPMKKKPIEVKIERFKPTGNEFLEREIKKNLASFFKENNFEKEITLPTLYRIVAESNYLGKYPESFEIKEGFAVPSEHEILILDKGEESIIIEY